MPSGQRIPDCDIAVWGRAMTVNAGRRRRMSQRSGPQTARFLLRVFLTCSLILLAMMGPRRSHTLQAPAKRTACPNEHRVQQHRVQQHSGSTPPSRHTLAVVIPVGSQQKAVAARGRVACSATSPMSQPTCAILAEDSDSVWPSAMDVTTAVYKKQHTFTYRAHASTHRNRPLVNPTGCPNRK